MHKKNTPNHSLRSFLKVGIAGIGGMTLGLPFGLSLTHAETRYSFIDANHHVSGTNRRWIQKAIKTMWRDRASWLA